MPPLCAHHVLFLIFPKDEQKARADDKDTVRFCLNDEDDNDESPQGPFAQLNTEQREAANRVREWLQQDERHRRDPYHNPSPPPLRLLVLGGPGSGKSFFAKTLIRYVEQQHGQGAIACAAPTGVASSVLPRGATIHSMFAIPVKKQNSSRKAKEQAELALRNVRLLIIDEISMVEAKDFERIDQRLKEFRKNTSAPFGGIGFILIGDFFQLPPIGKNLIRAMNAGVSTAGQLMRLFTPVLFQSQVRAQGDAQHTRLLQSFRDPINNPKPITPAVVEKLKVLTKSDILADPSWLDAPIVVAINSERLAINAAQIVRFAQSCGVPVIRWRNPLAESQVNPLITNDERDKIYNGDLSNELHSFFVLGAPVYLTNNICPQRGLANGTPGILDSLILDPVEADDFWQQYNAAAPGQILDLQKILISVNVRLIQLEEIERDTWPREATLQEHQIVIPLELSTAEPERAYLSKTAFVRFYSFSDFPSHTIRYKAKQLKRLYLTLASHLPRV